MTGKGSDSIGSTFITHTGYLLYRQSQCRETNAKLIFYLRVFGQLVKAPLSNSTEDLCPPQIWPLSRTTPDLKITLSIHCQLHEVLLLTTLCQNTLASPLSLNPFRL